MASDSLKRLDRIVAILIQLQSKRYVTSGELAERFNVSVRTIYRDIRSLEAAGIPLYSEAGSGYSLADGFRLAPFRFTHQEITTFVAAEKLVQHYMDKDIVFQFTNVMNKLKAMLRWSEKDWISELEPQVMVRPVGSVFNSNVPQAMAVLMESVARKKQVHLDYKAAAVEELSHRKIEPVGVFHENGHWYVMAFCHLRNAYRQFRTDRVQGIGILEAPFIHKHPPLIDFLKQKRQKEPKIEVTLRVDKRAARHLQYDKAFYGFVSEKENGETVEWTFHIRPPEEGFVRWYLMFADHATIIAPARLRDRARELLSIAARRLT